MASFIQYYYFEIHPNFRVYSVFLSSLLSVCAKSLQLCPTLCNPMDCSQPGSSVHGTRLGLCTFTTKGPGSTLVQGNKIPEAAWCGQLKREMERKAESNPGVQPKSLMSPALAGGFFTTSATWEAVSLCRGPANLLCNIPVLLYVLLKQALGFIPFKYWIVSHGRGMPVYPITCWPFGMFPMFHDYK